jgi:hypothetical protein
VTQCVPALLIAFIVGVSQPVLFSTIGAISSRSRSVIQIAGPSEKKIHAQMSAHPTNAESHAMAATFSRRGSGGGSPDGRRRR